MCVCDPAWAGALPVGKPLAKAKAWRTDRTPAWVAQAGFAFAFAYHCLWRKNKSVWGFYCDDNRSYLNKWRSFWMVPSQWHLTNKLSTQLLKLSQKKCGTHRAFNCLVSSEFQNCDLRFFKVKGKFKGLCVCANWNQHRSKSGLWPNPRWPQ